MTVSLETLELTAEQLQAARDAVQQMAYYHWLEAGCPSHGDQNFWSQAEREWIERCYVPCRALDGVRPAGSRQRVTSMAEQGLPTDAGALQSAT